MSHRNRWNNENSTSSDSFSSVLFLQTDEKRQYKEKNLAVFVSFSKHTLFKNKLQS